MRILIDGYNLLKALPECRALEALDPDGARDHLLDQLGRYRWLRGHHLTVVFDGWRGGQPVERHARAYGVQVIYSKRGEQADAVIRRLAPQVAHQGVVVTSDRALVSEVQRSGAEVIGSADFGERLARALFAEEEGMDNETAGDVQPKRKGAARRPSRAERQRERKLRNL
ncbi:MAG: NYN domain-containing protein [Nitrospinae bacterium]|nr:NYN domain-containing protein [Nitrospinota bacterium]